MATYFCLEICFNLNFPKYTYGRSKYIVIINVNKNSFRDWVGLVKNDKIFYSRCKLPILLVISNNEENISQHINISEAFKVIAQDCQLCAANDVEVNENHRLHQG